MITKENVQVDIDKIFQHIVECGLLENFRKYLEENRFDGDRYSNLRTGQRFIYNVHKFLVEHNFSYNFSTPDLFHCEDKDMVNKLLENFYLNCYEE